MTTSDRALYNTRNAIVIIVAAIVLVAAALAVITPHQALADHGQVHRTDLAAEDACWVADVNPETGRPIYAGDCPKDEYQRWGGYAFTALIVGTCAVGVAWGKREDRRFKCTRAQALAEARGEQSTNLAREDGLGAGALLAFIWVTLVSVMIFELVALTHMGIMAADTALQFGFWGVLASFGVIGWIQRRDDPPKRHDSDGERFGPYTGGRY